MNTMENLLRNHPFLEGMDKKVISKLARFAYPRYYGAGEYIFRQGEAAQHLYLIESGKIEIELFATTGGPMVVQTLKAGQVLGWSWLIPPYEWCFDARTIDPTEVIEVNAEHLRNLMQEDPQTGYEILQRFTRVIAERLYAERLQLVNIFAAHS